MLDWKTLAETAAIGTPFTNIVVRGLVQWLKKLTNKQGEQLLQGNVLFVASLISGMGFGGLFMFFTNPLPQTTNWYALASYGAGLVIYGLVQGFVASGIFDSNKDEVQKLLSQQDK